MISIIMPVYNGEKFMVRAIKSVISQSYKDWELLVIDDGSTDGSYKIAYDYAKLDERIIPLKNEKSSHGANAARNIGIRAAHGEYITFLDCDDYYLVDSLENRLECLKKHSDVSLVYGNAYGESANIRHRWNYVDITSTGIKKHLSEELSLCSQNTIMVKKDVIISVGTLDETLKCWSDDDLILSIAYHYKVKHCGSYVVAVVKDNSIMTSNKVNAFKGLKHVISKYKYEIVRYAGIKRLLLWYIRLLGAYFYAKQYESKGETIKHALYGYAHDSVKSFCSPFFRTYFE